MSLLRNESAALLDAAMSEADETIAVFEDLAGRLASQEARQLLEAAAAEQDGIMEALREDRRAHEDLPSIGDPERAHLRALATEAQALVHSVFEHDPGDATRIEKLVESMRSTRERFAEIPSEALSATQARLISEYRRSSETLEAALQRIAASDSPA